MVRVLRSAKRAALAVPHEPTLGGVEHAIARTPKKDERAMSMSGYVHQGRVKFSAPAFHKTTT